MKRITLTTPTRPTSEYNYSDHISMQIIIYIRVLFASLPWLMTAMEIVCERFKRAVPMHEFIRLAERLPLEAPSSRTHTHKMKNAEYFNEISHCLKILASFFSDGFAKSVSKTDATWQQTSQVEVHARFFVPWATQWWLMLFTLKKPLWMGIKNEYIEF